VDTSTPRRVLIAGLGASGLAAARLAERDGARLVLTDRRPEEELAEELGGLRAIDATFLGGHPLESLDGVDLVVASPGIPADAPLFAEARRRGIPVVPEVEFAWRRRRGSPLAAVTGSNGKSTVTTLITAMLSAGGIRAAAGANLGTPASQLVLDGGWDAWVLEISSFQAELMTEMAPRVAVFLNLSEDHLERHPGLDAYRDAKLRLFARQGPRDTAVLNLDDPHVAGLRVPGRTVFFSVKKPADAWLDGSMLRLGDEPLLGEEELGIPGRHNVANALAAALAARELGADRDAIAAALRRFEGLPHRHVTVFEARGVRWIDDSKATNVGATLAALGGYPPHSVHLILGGLGKGQDFSILAPEVQRTARRVYLIGRDAPLIAAALEGSAPLEMCGTLGGAVARARRQASAGETVLLAPACASFDQFSGYAERGDAFARLAAQEAGPCR